MSIRRRVIAAILPVCFIAAGTVFGLARDIGRSAPVGPARNPSAAAARAEATALQQTRTPIAAPEHWVPFEADLRVYIPGYSASVGKFARSADGSIRQSTGPSEDDVRVISIRNIATATYYVYAEGVWERSPMDVDPANYRPRGRLQDNPGIELYPFKLAFLPGQNLSVFGHEGIEVWRVLTGDGSVRLEAPSLNFFALVSQSISGRRQEFVNVRYVTPSPTLFTPPPGAQIKQVDETRGISRTPPKQLTEKHP